MTVHHIVPPYLLEHLERTADDPNLRARYRQSLEHDAVLRTRPAATPPAPGTTESLAEPTEPGEAEPTGPRRAVHDAEHGTELPGQLVRSEGDPEASDDSVNRAYDGTGATWTMFKECFGRDSIDGAGLQLSSTVHYDRDYANAFWDGARMVFGDGDGAIFTDFTSSLDVTAHELTHGVTQYTANLTYEGQSGALNESLSDVFGSLAKQHHLGQTAAEADWLIGADLFLPGVQAAGIRSLKEPGTAYDDPRLGRDPQPAQMDEYVETTDDNGGVHINSGIPNKAFYLVASELGGHAYEDAGRIWYAVLTAGTLAETATFEEFANATITAAATLFGEPSSQHTAVTTAWTQVGVLTSPGHPSTSSTKPEPEEPTDLIRAATTGLNTTTPPAPPPNQPAPPAAESGEAEGAGRGDQPAAPAGDGGAERQAAEQGDRNSQSAAAEPGAESADEPGIKSAAVEPGAESAERAGGEGGGESGS